MSWQYAVSVTPSDTEEVVFDALFVGGAGDVAIRDMAGNTTTWTVPAGAYVRCAGDRVMSTNTDATNIIALN